MPLWIYFDSLHQRGPAILLDSNPKEGTGIVKWHNMLYQVPLRHLRAQIGFVSLMCCFDKFAEAYRVRPSTNPDGNS